MNGEWIHMAATNLTMLRLTFDPGISLFTSLCSSVETDFGQSNFGHPYQTDFGQTNFGQTDFGES